MSRFPSRMRLKKGQLQVQEYSYASGEWFWRDATYMEKKEQENWERFAKSIGILKTCKKYVTN